MKLINVFISNLHSNIVIKHKSFDCIYRDLFILIFCLRLNHLKFSFYKTQCFILERYLKKIDQILIFLYYVKRDWRISL